MISKLQYYSKGPKLTVAPRLTFEFSLALGGYIAKYAAVLSLGIT